MLRVQIASDKIGSLILDGSDYGLDDPKGLDSLEQTIKRSDENDGVVYEITLALDWAKKARAFIAAAYETDGIEAVVIVNVYERDPNARTWELYYTGKLDMNKYMITEVLATLPISQISLQTKVLNLMETDVDLETQFSQNGSALPLTPTIDLEFHAKTIAKEYKASPIDSNEFQQLNVITVEFSDDGDTVYSDVVAYGQIDTSNKTFADLQETFTTPFGYSRVGNQKPSATSLSDFLLANLTPRNEVYRASEAGTISSIDISLRLKHKVFATNTGGDVDICGSGILGNVEFQAWIEHRRQDNTVVSLTPIDTPWSSPGCGGTERETAFETKVYTAGPLPVLVGDKFYVYFTGRVYGDYEEPNETPAGPGFVNHSFIVTPDNANTYINFNVETTFPATSHKSIMIYEALNKMVQYYTDQVDSFKSTFFGRTDTTPAYPQDGPGSLMAITNGRVLRSLQNLTIFANLDEAFKSLTAHWCLGWGFEVEDGINRVVIESKEHFWNKNLLTLELGRVQDIKKEVSMKHYYAQVEMSNPKLDAAQINGIDEPNTIRRVIAPLTQAKAKLSLKSLYRSSGYEIEAQRRLQSSTKDSRNDDSIFMAMVKRDGMTFKTERNEAFDIVTGLFDPATAYNLRITPMRNLRRWLIVLAAPLWAVTNKIYRFAYGETNYQMTSKLTSEPNTVAEDGDLDANNVEPLWLPEIYTFKSLLTRSQFKLVRQNPYGFIRFRDNLDTVMEGFILEASHKPNEKLGNFKLLRVFRNG